MELHEEDLKLLTQINLDDMLNSFGLAKIQFGRKLIMSLFSPAAERFARQVLTYDAGVDQSGLAEGSREILKNYVREVVIIGADYIPPAGPVLILSNHPGMTDTVALFSAIPRLDLRVLAAVRPFLRVLRATSKFLIDVPETDEHRFEVLRVSISHLRQGGAILTFPAGKIEPDPAVIPGAVESLADWSPSVGLFARAVPEAMIVPVIVSHVLAPQAVYHPLTHLRRRMEDRQRLAASLQIFAKVLFPKSWPITVKVHFLPPLAAVNLAPLHDPDKITEAIRDHIRPFLSEIVKNELPVRRQKTDSLS